MIEIKEKKDCCGCSACVQKCPKQCISLKEDNEGFLYPVVDKETCIDCGLCEKVCPVLHQGESREPLKVYAANNKDEEIRRQSSSGGIFTLLAEKTIQDGGVVFGVRFDEHWEVIHDYTETIEGLAAFRGSKYVQSRIEDNYRKAEAFLQKGRKVLFSGTPCQIAGLKCFLRKKYEKLLTVEVVCHGVPSPMIWRDYLVYKRAERAAGKNTVSSSLNELPVITGISFRDKTNGWKKFGFKICYAASKAAENSVSKSYDTISFELTPYSEDIFMKGFLKDLYLRPSCYSCFVRQGKSGADISIGDYWGIQRFHPKLDDDKGTELILINTENGYNCYDKINPQIESELSEYKKAVNSNSCIVQSVREPKCRKEFWIMYESLNVNSINPICVKIKLPFLVRCRIYIGGIIRKIIKR